MNLTGYFFLNLNLNLILSLPNQSLTKSLVDPHFYKYIESKTLK